MPRQIKDAIEFDIELGVTDNRPGMNCLFCLREVGGKRRLEWEAGIFEGGGFQSCLQNHFQAANALRHGFNDLALGGRLEYVVVDKIHTYDEANS